MSSFLFDKENLPQESDSEASETSLNATNTRMMRSNPPRTSSSTTHRRRTKRISRLQPQRSNGVDIFIDPPSRYPIRWPQERPFRSYYGSNVPALADISNSQEFEYRTHHLWIREGSVVRRTVGPQQFYETYDFLQTLEDRERLSPIQQIVGYYDWHIDDHGLDVWLWVKDTGLDRRWTQRQKDGFKAMLRVFKDTAQFQNHGPNFEKFRSGKFEDGATIFAEEAIAKFGITNLAVMKIARLNYYFCPVGYSKPMHHRSDFTCRKAVYIQDYKMLVSYWVDEDDEAAPAAEDHGLATAMADRKIIAGAFTGGAHV